MGGALMTASDLTWPALLAHWTAFAQSSLALPKTAEGDRFRAAIPAIIGLQAVTFALADLDKLTIPGERSLAIDKSEVLIRTHALEINTLWKSDTLPTEISYIIRDAHAALAAGKTSGVEWRVTTPRLVAQHPGDLLTALVAAGFKGDLFLPVPGTVLFQAAPAAFARAPRGDRPDEHTLRAVKEFLVDVTRPERAPHMRQVYRQFDFGTGSVRRDLIAPASQTNIPGQPQLIPVIQRGRALSVHLPIPGMASLHDVPVEFATEA